MLLTSSKFSVNSIALKIRTKINRTKIQISQPPSKPSRFDFYLKTHSKLCLLICLFLHLLPFY